MQVWRSVGMVASSCSGTASCTTRPPAVLTTSADQFRPAPPQVLVLLPQLSSPQELGLSLHNSSLVVNGGSVASGFGRVIMANKVLREKPAVRRAQLLTSLAETLAVA